MGIIYTKDGDGEKRVVGVGHRPGRWFLSHKSTAVSRRRDIDCEQRGNPNPGKEAFGPLT
jgi:hypothetical protein